jgi:hypothetical protein
VCLLPDLRKGSVVGNPPWFGPSRVALFLPERKAMIQHGAIPEAGVHLAADESGEFTEQVLEARMDVFGDQLALARIVGLQGIGDRGGDVLVGDASPAGLGSEGGVPGRCFGGWTEIRVEEPAAGSQHAGGFREEPIDVAVAVAALHVDDGIEAGVGKRQVFGVADGKGKIGDGGVALLAEGNGLGEKSTPARLAGWW